MSIKHSFSLIEVIIFVSILSILLIASASIITVSIRQNAIRINTLKATHYNEQLNDWIRNEKETEWAAFTLKAGGTSGYIYCFNSEAITWPAGSVADKNSCPSTLGGIYRRYLQIKSDQNPPNPPTRIEAAVYSEWQEADNIYSTKLHSIYSIWEN